MNIKKDLLTIHYTPDGIKEHRGIVLHSMWGSYAGSIAWFKNPTNPGSSAHYLISAEGEITQMVEEKDMAWHAGIIDDVAPEWVRPNPNWYTIGIELEDKQDPNWQYPEAQRKALVELVSAIQKRYSIDNDHVILHKEINPSRRSDPVGAFSRDWLFANQVSVLRQLITDILLALKDGTTENEIDAWEERFVNPQKMIEDILSGDGGAYKKWIKPHIDLIEQTKNTEIKQMVEYWQKEVESAKKQKVKSYTDYELFKLALEKLVNRFKRG